MFDVEFDVIKVLVTWHDINKMAIHSSARYLKWCSLMDIWFILLLVCYVTTTCRVRFTTNVTTALMSNVYFNKYVLTLKRRRGWEKLVKTNYIYFKRSEFVFKRKHLYVSFFWRTWRMNFQTNFVAFHHTCLKMVSFWSF